MLKGSKFLRPLSLIVLMLSLFQRRHYGDEVVCSISVRVCEWQLQSFLNIFEVCSYAVHLATGFRQIVTSYQHGYNDCFLI